jgi:hypothetical protein
MERGRTWDLVTQLLDHLHHRVRKHLHA